MKRVWATLSLVLVIIVAQLPAPQAKAVNDNIWQGTVTITAKDPLTLQQVTNRPDCDFREVYAKVYGQPLDDLIALLASGNYASNNLGVKCVLSNDQGYFTNLTYSHEAFGPAYELEHPATSTSWYDPAPASDPVLLINKPAGSTLYTVGVEYDFATNGQPTLSLTNVKWHYNGGALPLTDLNGNSVRLSNHAFSANGRYMAVRYNGEVAVVDFDNLSLTPVGYFSSWSNSSELAISPNGRYVAVENNGIYVFDAENCQTSYAYGHWDLIQTINPLGCTKSPNLRTQLLTTMGVSQLVSDFQRMRFLGDSSTLYIGAGVRRADAPPNLSGPSAYDWAEYSLRPDGFQNTASGYLAMGDSFSSGEGDTEGGSWYEQGTDEHGDENTFAGRNLCHLSRRSYPYLMAMNLGYLTSNIDSPPADGLFHSVACSGAKMHNITGIIGEKQDDGTAVDFAITDNQYRYDASFILNGWQPGASKQVNFLVESKLPINEPRPIVNPGAITISIGGNDVGFGPKIMACVNVGTCPFADTFDDSYRAQAVMEMAKELDNLTKTYEKLKQSAPESRIYVIGYPQFVQPTGGPCANNVHLDDQERQFVSMATGYFNQIIEASAKRAGVTYVDVSDIFAGTNLCSGANQENITVNGATAGNDASIPLPGNPEGGGIYSHGLCIIDDCIGQESFHPNPKGHELYSAKILQSTNQLTISNPVPEEVEVPVPDVYFGFDAQAYVNYLNGDSLDEYELTELANFVSGIIDYKQPSIEIADLLPNSEVTVELHSDPINLGNFSVSNEGILNTNLTIPESITPGYHEIHIYGLDRFGNKIHKYQPVIIGHSIDDFDGDGVNNDIDSCPTINNANIDVDNDGIDDACDIQAIATVVDPPTDPPDDNPEPECSEKHHKHYCEVLDWEHNVKRRFKKCFNFWQHGNKIVKKEHQINKIGILNVWQSISKKIILSNLGL